MRRSRDSLHRVASSFRNFLLLRLRAFLHLRLTRVNHSSKLLFSKPISGGLARSSYRSFTLAFFGQSTT
jgi:hypothetical protein